MNKNVIKRILSFTLLISMLLLNACNSNNQIKSKNIQIKQNEQILHKDGLYKKDDIVNRFNSAIAGYNILD